MLVHQHFLRGKDVLLLLTPSVHGRSVVGGEHGVAGEAGRRRTTEKREVKWQRWLTREIGREGRPGGKVAAAVACGEPGEKGLGFVWGLVRQDEDGIGCVCAEGIGQILVHVHAAYPANTSEKRAHQS